MYWAASCGGCEIAVLNIHEKLLAVDAAFELAFWPCVMDAKYSDLEALPNGAITLTLFNGGIRSEENAELARLLRRKSQILVAFGSCACEGCIPGLANLSSLDQLFSSSYDGPSTVNPAGIRPQTLWPVPEGELHLPALFPRLHTLDTVIPVDYYMPGCPPESAQIAAVIELVIEALAGRAELPPKGSVLGVSHSTVCDECSRQRHVKTLTSFRRIQHIDRIDPNLCLLEQGLPCNGPATAGGCGACCPAANAPCIGCYGPAEATEDFGAKLISAFASILEGRDPAEIERALDTLPDPVGQVYRFSLAGSTLRAHRAVAEALAEEDRHAAH